ncbi:troponin T isoform X3 [Eurytemora carolleeae]|uniref:troponin T isoform X3 n=1 Tax=Eurytemora carolleeae TaxID=1294199 RepID=UPI000C7746A3|nr:troponin T isoform X3 [Eurytemora carolleeae]|eukprot:XP_023339791.1 troponin T-like isoform X3 [Eurytemora affinis]
MSDEEYYEEEEVSNTSKKGDGNFLKARQEAKKGELDEQLREYINEWRKQRAKEEEELKRLKEKQAKRKEIRAEQEKKLAQQKKEEEERLRKEEAEKKAKEAEEKRKRLEEAEKKRQAMMQAQKEKQQAGGPGKGGQKKTDGGMSNVQDARREMTKTKEQLEEEKKISLSIRIKPLELDGMDSDFLKQKASELWELIIRLETEKYDLEERQRRQDYDLKELKERQKQQLRQKAMKKGLDPEALTGKYPPKILTASKFERRADNKTYDDKLRLFDGGWEILYCEILEKDWKEKFEDWGKKNNKAKLPKWFGERPGKKPGDPESPDDEDEGPAEVPPGAEEEEEEDEEEEEEEEEEE